METGKSEARERQGGDIVPVPPRSCTSKSCDGPTLSSTVSGREENVIAEEPRTRREDKEELQDTDLDLDDDQLMDVSTEVEDETESEDLYDKNPEFWEITKRGLKKLDPDDERKILRVEKDRIYEGINIGYKKG